MSENFQNKSFGFKKIKFLKLKSKISENKTFVQVLLLKAPLSDLPLSNEKSFGHAVINISRNSVTFKFTREKGKRIKQKFRVSHVKMKQSAHGI